jgi:hypothetical protein
METTKHTNHTKNHETLRSLTTKPRIAVSLTLPISTPILLTAKVFDARTN